MDKIMGDPTKSEPEPTTLVARWSLRLPFILLVLAGMGVLAFGGFRLLCWLVLGGWGDDTQIKVVAPEEVARSVATFLVAD